MAALVPMIAGYALKNVQDRAAKNLDYEFAAKAKSLQQIFSAEDTSVSSGQGSFIGSDAGQAALKEAGLPKDVIMGMVASHRAYAGSFGGTARGQMAAGANQATQPGEAGQRG